MIRFTGLLDREDLKSHDEAISCARHIVDFFKIFDLILTSGEYTGEKPCELCRMAEREREEAANPNLTLSDPATKDQPTD